MLLAAAVLAVFAVPTAAPASATTCDRFASRTGSDLNAGSEAAPFKTAQKLADALTAGQTGCLRAGTYSELVAGYVVKFRHGGTAGAPLRMRSYPGERATLRGVVEVKDGSSFVTISDLDVVGTDNDADPAVVPVSVQLMAADTIFERNRVTNGHLKSCMIIGSNAGWGQGLRTIVRGNEFHDCGDPAHGMLDHAIYVENTVDAEIADNVIWGSQAYGVHLYPNAQRTRVHHNVMDGNGGGVIFAGSTTHASGDDVVERNVISNTLRDYNITYWWGGAIGTGNVARDNCLFNGSKGNVIASPKGFVASANVVADPAFLDRGAHDYRLAVTSSCLPMTGYDVAAKVADGLAGTVAIPAPAPAPVATPVPTVEPTATAVATPEPTAVPTAEPTVTTVATTEPTPAPTAAPTVDAAPTVTLLAPTAGASFGDRLVMSAAATDDAGVAQVEFLVDGAVRATDATAPYEVNWKVPRGLAAGSHTVTARAYDSAGQVASASTQVIRVKTATRTAASSAGVTRTSVRRASRRRTAQRKLARR